MLNPSRHQVLIVEDNAAVRSSLSLLLKASGYDVSTAANGLEAVALLRAGLPAVLLSDLQMPVMSGYELLAIARKEFPSLSLIAMSAAYETQEAVPGGVTADAYYAKGHGSLKSLLRIISEMTSAVHAADSTAKPEPSIN
jgi:CheY-like chemotaxis protein